MPVVISLLRGINLGKSNRIKMDALCSIYKSLKLQDPRTHIQSGNVIFRTKESNVKSLSGKIQRAIEQQAGFRCEVILRTADELQNAIAANPFAKRRELDPARLLINFLADEPAAEAKAFLRAFKTDPEELHLIGRELYIYFPNGAGNSKLQWSTLDKKLGTHATARNLNSVVKILAIAREMENAI